MSKKRRPALDNKSEDRFQIRSLALNCPTGYQIPLHSHEWHQFIYASHGVMTVDTSTGSWVVPSRRAVWVPAGMQHRIEMLGQVEVRTLYLRDGLWETLPKDCCVMNVSPLLRELILHTIDIGMLDCTVAAHCHLIGVLVDQLQAVNTVPLKLPMPNDKRAARIAESLRASPGDTRSLDEVARNAGAAQRTIARIFVAETAMTFGKWRQQLRLLHALRLLASGQSVTGAALEVGYDSTSAFISAFKHVLGTTPGRYYSELRASRTRLN